MLIDFKTETHTQRKAHSAVSVKTEKKKVESIKADKVNAEGWLVKDWW